jgi:hypothetical protein
MEKRRQPEIIAGTVNADTTIARGDGFTVQKTSTGSYLLLFPSGFRITGITANDAGSASYVVNAGPSGERSAVVGIYLSNTGAATDRTFTFVAVGVQQ